MVIWVCFGYSGGHGEGPTITAVSLLRVNWWIRKFDFNLLLLTLDRFRLSCASIRAVIWSWVFRIFVDDVNNYLMMIRNLVTCAAWPSCNAMEE
jgi:hypothetical protein